MIEQDVRPQSTREVICPFSVRTNVAQPAAEFIVNYTLGSETD